MVPFKQFFKQYILNENVWNNIPRNVLGMETTYENFPMEQPYGFWVDRSGNWREVENQGHLDTAIDIIGRSNDYLKSNGLPTIDTYGQSTYNILFKSGFMRLTTNPYNFYYELFEPTAQPTPSQKKFLSMCEDMYEGKFSRG